jgi:hypothetical protein
MILLADFGKVLGEALMHGFSVILWILLLLTLIVVSVKKNKRK